MEFYTNKALDPKRKKRYTRAELKNYNVVRSTLDNPLGMKIERRIAQDGSKKFFIQELVPGSLIDRQGFDLEVGDRIVELNGYEMDEFPGLYQVNELLKLELDITISLLKEEKEKKWLHAPKTQYAGQLDKPQHEEEFRPESTSYPAPKPKGKVPAIFKKRGAGRSKSPKPSGNVAGVTSTLANTSLSRTNAPMTAATPSYTSAATPGTSVSSAPLPYHPANEPEKLSKPAVGSAKSNKGWSPVAKEWETSEKKKSAQTRVQVQDEWDEEGNLTRTTIKHIIEPGWTNSKKVKTVEVIPAAEAAKYRK